jgi:Flp pilus assembly protein TadD/predicted  nucleic acid-binding Zn-ribbon protein
MRQPFLLLLACFAVATHSIYAESSDPGDLFVSAYMAVQAGEKAEQAGNVKDATSKLRYAAQVLEQISERYPSWQPSIIDYRKKRTAEALARIQEKIAHTGGAKAEPSMTVAPPAAQAPAASSKSILPGLPDDILPNTPAPPPAREPATTKRTPERRAVEPDLPASTPAKEIEQRLEKMQKELEKVRAEAQRAEKEKADLAEQLRQATAAREAADKKQSALSQRSAATEAALAKAKEEGQSDTAQSKQLVSELASVRKQLRDLKFEADAEAEYRQQLSDRVRATQNKISRLSAEKAAAEQASSDMPGKVAGYEKQLEDSRKEKNDLVIKLSRTETDLKTAMSARDEALSQVARMKEAQKQVDKLLADNATLMAKLSEAEKNISEFKADGVKKDQEIASLRKEATSLKDQLAKAQQESVDYQKQMADLQTRLAQANTQIADMKTEGAKAVAERGRLLEENQVLRGIVLRGQKEEARRAQTKKLVLAELAKLENKSKVLMDQIDYLSGPVVNLSPKERDLFKKPELQISDSEISLAVPRPENAAATPETLPQVTEAPAPPAPAKVASATPAPVKAPEPATVAANTKPAPPAATPVAKPAAPPGVAPSPPEKPALTLGTGVGVRTLAKNEPPTPFSNLPDGLAPKLGEPATKASPAPSKSTTVAKLTTPAPQDELPTKAPAKVPEKVPEKAPEPAVEMPASGTAATTGLGENPLASSATGTANVSGAVMNLPPDLAVLAREGKEEFDRGNYREAEKVYERVLAKAPNNLYTLSNLGVVYFRGQKFKRAEEMFKKAIAIAPEDGFSHCTLGIVYYSQATPKTMDLYDKALDELTKALAINPKNATAHNYLGITASQKGWQEAAQKELETATALDPNYADAHFNLAVVFATQQPPNKESARKCYKRATELGAEPDSALEQMIK